MACEDSERALEFGRARGHSCYQILSPAFAKSMRNSMKLDQHSGQIQVSLPRQRPTPNTQHTHSGFVTCFSSERCVSPTLLYPSLLRFPPNKASHLKSPVVQMTKTFHCTKWPRCARFFLTAHTTAWHRLWVSHIILLSEKVNKIHKALTIVLSMISASRKV